MRRLKRVIALIAVCALVLQVNAFASLVLTKETSVDLWYKIFYSDQARLYPNQKGYENNTIWPGSKNVHGYSVMESLKPGGKSVQEVFGSDSLNLLFSEGDSVYSTGLYLKDEGRTVQFYGMQEWNGYLFCAVGGPAKTISTVTHTSDDGSTVTEYETHDRKDSFQAIDGQRVYYEGYYDYDSYLYIFDLSKDTWYGESRYAKWSIDDLGIQPDGVRRQVIEDVSVDDDYIYLTLNKNVADGRDATRSVAVFENNIDRDNPIYDNNTGDIKVPDRVEPVGSYSEATASKEIIPNSRAKATGIGQYESAMINGYLVSFVSGTDIPLAQGTDAKRESIFHVTDMKNVATEGVGETKTHYLTPGFNKESDCSNVFVSQFIPIGGGRTWNSVKDAYIRNIIAEGSTIYILTTYTDKAEDGSDVYKQKLFITDWTNPLRPILLSEIELIDEVTMFEATRTTRHNNTVIPITSAPAELYYYDGYFYITSSYGVSIVKKYNDMNILEPKYITSFNYIEDGVKNHTNFGYANLSIYYNSIPMIASVGNCMVLNYKDSNNHATQVELRLSPDKLNIEEATKSEYVSRMIPMDQIPQGRITRYGSRIYIGTNGSTTFSNFPARVHVFDFKSAFPVELSLDHINAKVGAPYTITGGGMGINAVQIKINGEEMGYVNVHKASGKYGTWEYTVTEPGEYTFEAVGATLAGFPKNETREIVTFEVVATGDLTYEADITETVDEEEVRKVVISPRITSNTMTGFVDVMPVAAAYEGNTMITMAYGDKVKVEQGANYTFEDITLVIPDSIGGYTVKTFLFDGKETISAMADYIEKDF